MTSLPTAPAAAVALTDARQALEALESEERMFKRACDHSRDMWLQGLSHSPTTSHGPLYEAFKLWTGIWTRACEDLATGRRRVAECEADLATAQKEAA